MSAVVRTYDPCLSCSTHANALLARNIRLVVWEVRLHAGYSEDAADSRTTPVSPRSRAKYWS